MSFLITRFIIMAVLLIAAALLLFSPVMSDDDKMEDYADSIISTTVQDIASPQLDSIYTEINAGFQQLEPIFMRACYDCHTNRTRYPWYHKIPGVKQLIDHDIEEGLEHLDLSDGFPFTGKKDISSQAHLLDEINEVLEEGEMPILIYRMMHWGAAPSDEEKDSIYIWIENSLELLQQPQE